MSMFSWIWEGSFIFKVILVHCNFCVSVFLCVSVRAFVHICDYIILMYICMFCMSIFVNFFSASLYYITSTRTRAYTHTNKQTRVYKEETLYRCFFLSFRCVFLCTYVCVTPPHKRTTKERRNERWTTGSEKRASPSLSVIRIITGEVQLLINIYSCVLAAFTAYVVVVLVIVALQKRRDFEYDLIFQDQ